MAIRVSVKKARELGIIPKAAPSKGGMNSLEERYAGYLEQQSLAGEIKAYRFEALKLILVHGVPGKRKEMSYRPDFLILTRTNNVEFHEVKGYLREDAQIKLKVAAELFPWFKFILVTRNKGAWVFNEY